MNWKDFLYFQRGERMAVILLLILIVLVLMLNIVLQSRRSKSIVFPQNDSLSHQFEDLSRSLKEKDREYSIDYNNNTARSYPKRTTHSDKFSTDKNGPSSINHTSYPKVEKLSVGETISLNETDTTQWKKVPGIGHSFALRIVKYRNLLGGFASSKQLLEVYGIDKEMLEKIAPFIAEDNQITKLKINKLDFKQLLHHPYLNYEQVKSITDLRHRKGNIHSLRELEMLNEFSAADIDRLRPYLEF